MLIGKDHRLKIGLLLILFATVLLSVYSIWNYHGDSVSKTSDRPQQGFQAGNNRFSNPTQPAPPGREFVSPNSSGHKAPFSGNRQPPKANMFREAVNSNNGYNVPLSYYSVFFLGLFAFAYYLFSRYKMRIQDGDKKIILWTLLGVGLFLRIAAAPWVGGHPDLNLFKNWAMSAAQDFRGFYLNGSSDYPPFYIYILALIGKMVSVPALSSYFTLLIKMPSILADLITAYLIYRLAVKYHSFETSLLVSAFYIFNPAIFINSTFWGQVDSFFTLIVALALFMLSEKKLSMSAALFTTAVLMKPQGIIFLPVLFFELVRMKNVKHFLYLAVTSLGTALAIILPFSWGQEPLWIFKLFSRTVGEYPYASVNAFNFFSLLGANYTQDKMTRFVFSYHTWGMICIIMVTLFSWFIYIKGHSTKFVSVAALLQIAGVFTFSTGMHERYLFPAVALALLAFIYLRDKRLLWLSVGFSATSFINTYTVFNGTFSDSAGVPYHFTLIITSLLNVTFFIYLVIVVWDIVKRENERNGKASALLS